VDACADRDFLPRSWRSAYISQLFSLRNRILVGTDWLKSSVLGRDVSRE